MSASHDEGQRVRLCRVEELPRGACRLVEVGDRRIGVYNVEGSFYALHDRCPHRGGSLCAGPLTGTTAVDDHGRVVYERAGRVVRCSWHGWEFDVTTGQALADPRTRARRYEVEQVDGELFLVSAGLRKDS